MSDYNYGPIEHELAGGTFADKGNLKMCCTYAVAVQDDPIDNGKRLQCDGCGRWLQFSKLTGWIYLRHDEPPAPRAGERDEWRILETVTRTSVINQRGENVAVGMGRGARQRREHAEQIVSDHNQHATLVEQRDRLVTALREYVTDRCNCYQGTQCQNCETKALLATIEQEGEA